MDRHVRQVALAGVGTEGQTRIATAVVDVRLAGMAADVAARYLAGAGVACIRIRDQALARGASALAPAVRIQVDPTLALEDDAILFGLRDPSARDLAAGAHAALCALRAALGSGGS
jgi:hypothetical protein